MLFLRLLFAPGLLFCQNKDIHQYQHDSMLLMIGLSGITHSLRRELVSRNFVKNGDNMDNVCKWNGISCERKSDMITKIRWVKRQVPIRMELGWLPLTVQELYLQNLNLKSQINTSVLPRDLKVCEIIKCQLTGEIEMRTLPQKQLKTVYLQNNSLSGRIHLTSLPASIERIDLSHNFFRSLVIVNSSLPDGFEGAVIKTDRKLDVHVLDGKSCDSRVMISHY